MVEVGSEAYAARRRRTNSLLPHMVNLIALGLAARCSCSVTDKRVPWLNKGRADPCATIDLERGLASARRVFGFWLLRKAGQRSDPS